MAEENKVLRKQLLITSVGMPRPIGQATLYPFKAAIVGKTEEKDYETWSKTLSDELRKDTEIDADIEYSQKGEYKHRKVTQIYKSGQPILKPKPSRGFAGKPARDEDRTDIRTAMMSIAQVWSAGRITEKDPLVTQFRTWCYGLDASITNVKNKKQGLAGVKV